MENIEAYRGSVNFNEVAVFYLNMWIVAGLQKEFPSDYRFDTVETRASKIIL